MGGKGRSTGTETQPKTHRHMDAHMLHPGDRAIEERDGHLMRPQRGGRGLDRGRQTDRWMHRQSLEGDIGPESHEPHPEGSAGLGTG